MKIWFAEDLDCDNVPQHGYGKTKREAESFISGNRAYDNYDGSRFKECVKDGWAEEAIQIEVPKAVAEQLLYLCRR